MRWLTKSCFAVLCRAVLCCVQTLYGMSSLQRTATSTC